MWTIFISIKYFLSKKREWMISLVGAISVLGIALGVASLIVVLSVMNGFDEEVKNKIIGTNAHVVIMKEGGLDNYEKLISDFEAAPEIEKASPFITTQAILRKGRSATGILLKGIDIAGERGVSEMLEYAGTAGAGLKEGAIILGSELMRNEGIGPGETVEVLVPYSDGDFQKLALKAAGSFKSGRYDYDANIALVDIKTAQRLLNDTNNVTGLGIRIADGMKAESVKINLQSKLGYPYVVKSWMDLDRNLVRALALEKKMMFIILALIIIIACFNISSSLIMMVMEKVRDIGILKAIGATGASVKLIFLLEGAIIGVAGIILGTLSGVFITAKVNVIDAFFEKLTGMTLFPADVYYFTGIPVRISFQDIGIITLVAFALSLAASAYPARRAARLDPVEAIRYE